uniref:Uncharacterized protein n=1 Tax=viral metagenome TaxID=1070528 RepID=A0A6H1ZGQ7_9ZZZZ
MNNLAIDNKLTFSQKGKIVVKCHNRSGATLWPGDVVILDTTNSTDSDICVTIGNTADDVLVFGMVMEQIPNLGYGDIQTDGPTALLRADGNTDIAAGDELACLNTADYTTGTATFTLGSTTVAGGSTVWAAAHVGCYITATTSAERYRITAVGSTTSLTIDHAFGSATETGVAYAITFKGKAMKATTAKGGNFAVALEAYTTNDAGGVLNAWLHAPARIDASAGGNTLDEAYDEGGVGAGRTVTVDQGAVVLAGSHATNDVLQITGASGSGALIDLAQSGTGADIEGTGDTWTVSKAGVAKFDSLNTVGVIIFTADTLGTGSPMIGSDNTGDVTVNALTGKIVHLAVNDVDVVDVAGAAITLKQAVTVSTGGIAVTGASSVAGAVTVSTGGIAVTGTSSITGNTTITGDLLVSGSLTFGGNWTVGATLTVDELILDTDGTQPAGTNCYWVRDNAGDLTGNAITGKQVLIAINNTDEYTFSVTILDMNANALDNCGYIILNAATNPAGSEVFVSHDNIGDLTLNALTGKSIHFAINAVDILDLTATTLTFPASTTVSSSGTLSLGAITLGGAVACGDQAMTGVGDMTFTNGSILQTGVTASDTLLFKAYDNDTGPAYQTFITLTAGNTPACELDACILDTSVAKGTWTASGTWTIPAVTLSGAVTGGTQNLTALGNISFATGAGRQIFHEDTGEDNEIAIRGGPNAGGSGGYIAICGHAYAGTPGALNFYTSNAAGTGDVQRLGFSGAADRSLATFAVTDVLFGTGYTEYTERVAPGAGAANTARIYAVVDGGTLTDLAAVFQDGTVDIFAQEVTPLDAPTFTNSNDTEVKVVLRKEHPGQVAFVAKFADGKEFTLKEYQYHDADKIAANKGTVSNKLPAGWAVETTVQREARWAAAEATRLAAELANAS